MPFRRYWASVNLSTFLYHLEIKVPMCPAPVMGWALLEIFYGLSHFIFTSTLRGVEWSLLSNRPSKKTHLIGCPRITLVTST